MLQSGYVTYLKHLKVRHIIAKLEVRLSVPHKQIMFEMIDWKHWGNVVWHHTRLSAFAGIFISFVTWYLLFRLMTSSIALIFSETD
jgi:hypothetical protein